MGYRPPPLKDNDYAILRSVTGEPERARTIAARYSGLTEREAVDSDYLTEVARALQRLAAHGLVRHDYLPEGTAYALTHEGAKAAGFGGLLEQAA